MLARVSPIYNACKPANGINFFNVFLKRTAITKLKRREVANKTKKVAVGKLTAITIKNKASPNPNTLDREVFNLKLAYT